MTYVTFILANGEKYGLPLEAVANKRATYYSVNDPDTTFQEEYDYVMSDDYVGIDWYSSNCNPEDFPIESFILLKKPETIDFIEALRDAYDYKIEEIL